MNKVTTTHYSNNKPTHTTTEMYESREASFTSKNFNQSKYKRKQHDYKETNKAQIDSFMRLI
jgi:hypothetical protein